MSRPKIPATCQKCGKEVLLNPPEDHGDPVAQEDVGEEHFNLFTRMIICNACLERLYPTKPKQITMPLPPPNSSRSNLPYKDNEPDED